jgi:hypothetical protein
MIAAAYGAFNARAAPTRPRRKSGPQRQDLSPGRSGEIAWEDGNSMVGAAASRPARGRLMRNSLFERVIL